MPLSNPTPPIAALAASAIAALLVWAAVGAWLIAWKRPEDRRIAGWMGAAAMAAAAYAALEVAQYLGAELWAMEARASLGLIRLRGMALVLLLFAVSEIADAGSKERFPLPRTGRGALAIGLAGLVGLTPWVVGPLRTVRLSWAGEVMVPQPTLAFVAWGIALFTGSAYVWIWLFGGLAARHRRAMGIGAVALHAAAAVDLMTSIGLVAPVGTPDEILDRLNAATNRYIDSTAFKTRILAEGGIVAGGSRADFQKFAEAEMAVWRKLVVPLKLELD